MRRPDLQAEIAYWQEELRLRDWRITAEYVPDLCNRAGEAVHGLCSYLEDSKEARIYVRDPATPIPGDDKTPEDRVALVCAHEVAHLHWAPLGLRSKAEITVEENAVWATSEALVRLRGTPRGEVLARAMRAHVAAVVAARNAAVVAERRSGVDKAQIEGAIAALESGDGTKALDVLKAILMAAVGGGEEPAPPSEPMGMDGEPGKPPMAMGEDPKKEPMAMQEPKYQRAAPAPVNVEQIATRAAQAVADRMQRDMAIERAASAGLLDEDEARYARSLEPKAAEGFIKLRASKAAPQQPAQAQRNQSPTRGAGAAYEHPVLENIDRHMGVMPDRPRIQIDPRTGNLSISHLPVQGRKGA